MREKKKIAFAIFFPPLTAALLSTSSSLPHHLADSPTPSKIMLPLVDGKAPENPHFLPLS